MLTAIRLKNFKALYDTNECQVGKITLLTGINGRGKSSFLQSILLISQSMRKNGGSPKLLDPVGDWCKLGNFDDVISTNAHGPISIEYKTDSKTEKSFVLQYKKSQESDLYGEATSIKIDDEETISFDAGTPESAVNSNATAIGAPDELIKATGTLKGRSTYEDIAFLTSLQNLYFVSADRFSAQNSETLNKTTRDKYLGEHGQYVLNVLSQCTQEQLDKLVKAMGEILDGASLKIDVDKINDRVYLYLGSQCDGEVYKPINVGYGYSYIISTLLSAILVPANGILIIENPEAHLHPQAQARLMKYLIRLSKEKNVQCFIETHSDHIVNGLLVSLKESAIAVEDASILFFDRKTQDYKYSIDVTNLEITQSGRVRRPPKGFCDQYGIDLRKLI